jgi:hypothetical protein
MDLSNFVAGKSYRGIANYNSVRIYRGPHPLKGWVNYQDKPGGAVHSMTALAWLHWAGDQINVNDAPPGNPNPVE